MVMKRPESRKCPDTRHHTNEDRDGQDQGACPGHEGPRPPVRVSGQPPRGMGPARPVFPKSCLSLAGLDVPKVVWEW